MLINKNKKVLFKNDTARVYNENKELIFVSKIKDKLFPLKGSVMNKNTRISTNYVTKCMFEKERLYRILGHVNFKDLKFFVS